MKLTMHPLTAERWPDLEAVFNARGCSETRRCWCMFYRHSGRYVAPKPGVSQRETYRAELRRLARKADPPPGLLAYRGSIPVGWVSLGPREDFARLQRSPAMKPVDDRPVWSIVCFVVPSQYRGQGIAKALLAGAIAFARRRGARLLEAYPVDKTPLHRTDPLWFGVKSMFDAAGFKEVARRRPTRPVVRLPLAKPSRAS
jgi:GNAT superfamily N-acetyltransferase